MLGVENTGSIVYHYLCALHVKVSKATIARLLNNPLGNSMRGISDVLDAFRIENAVYQLPITYFDKLESPFIAMTNDNDSPFCLVERIEEENVTITIPHAQRMRVSKQQFLRKWTGGVLVGEVTENSVREENVWLKDLEYWIYRHQLLLIGLVASLLIVYGTNSSYSNGMTFYLLTLCAGILISSAILYKENVNSRFLHRFCHIGEAVDCNKVLRSKGSQLLGIGLGELSLFYFSVMLLFSLIRSSDFYLIAVVCGIIAIAFTIYSVIYQSFIIRKGCLLCMLVNLTVWSNCIALYTLQGLYQNTSIQTILALAALSGVCVAGWIQFKALLKANKERVQLKAQFADLLNPETFQKLLSLTPQIGKMISSEIALHNRVTSENEIMIVTSPTCKNCAKAHRQMKDVASQLSLSLVLFTFPNDKLGERIAQIILTVYLQDGWEKAMLILEQWYETNQIKEVEKYCITEEAQQLWKQQQVYCRQQQINRTPSIIVDAHYIPDVYQLTGLKYVLT